MTLFQHLKEYINDNWGWGNGEFTTAHMRHRIGQYETLTSWKKYNKNPNYTLHVYLGQLRQLGCIKRIRHGRYEINGPIPVWFGSYHFNGLKGHLVAPSNKYWNSLPDEYKVNPWAKFVEQEEEPQLRIEEALGGVPEWDPQTRTKYPANVENSLEFRIAELRERFDKQSEELQAIRNTILQLEAELDNYEVELRYRSEYVDRIFEVTYLGDEYRVIHTYNSDDVFDESWKVDNYVDSEIDNTDIAEHLISWVKENCK